jgi:hypothetical protein
MRMDKKVKVNAIYEFGIGGRGSRETEVDYQTAQLMVNADVITIEGTSFKVKYVEVTDKDIINFYVSEIKKSTNEELSINHIESAY